MPLTSAISKNMKKYRAKLGVTQWQLFKQSGIPYNTILKIERGVSADPRIKTLKRIADALKVGVDDLIK